MAQFDVQKSVLPNRPHGGKRTMLALALALALSGAAHGADAPSGSKPPIPALLQSMAGDWRVTQKMWPGRGQAAVDLPAATAHRRLVEDSFLEEVMQPVQANGADSFNRTAYFEFNTTAQRYEYFSLDSRLPQMMNERSAALNPLGGGTIRLAGSRFVAPSWGKGKNVPFRYRLTVSEVLENEQTVQMYLTPESGIDRQEFLAFEYRYQRAR